MKYPRLGLPLLLLVSQIFAQDIPKGFKVSIRTNSLISSDRNVAGDPVDAVLASDLAVGGKVIAREGDPVRASVAFADPSRSGRFSAPGSIAIRLETIETAEGTYHLSTNQYTRQGRGRGSSPIPGGPGGGVSIDSVGGIHRQSPFPTPDASGVNIGGTGPEAIIPPQSVITFKTSAISKPVPKN
ncbi:MAG TPA: hypothetical protein VFA68_15710 [Terriglobales bacterium]|nr:hypothetical protein [Terriglobales bacterium]